jgi:aspartyl-tRNA synthetase
MDDRTYTADAEPGTEATVAGWVHEVRDLGGIAFLILRDKSGKIQVKFEKDEMDDGLVDAGLSVHRESVVRVDGRVEEEERAPTGVEVVPDSLEVVAEADPELPLDPSGKVDADLSTRLDNRTLAGSCAACCPGQTADLPSVRPARWFPVSVPGTLRPAASGSGSCSAGTC